MLSTAGSRGFSIVELMIAVALIGLLIALGAPALGTYLQNSKLSSAAAGFYSGVQTARTEAIRRNTAVEFVMTDSLGTASAVAATATPSLSGRGWIVRVASGAGYDPIDYKPSTEAQGQSGSPTLQTAASGPTGFSGIIAFGGLGAPSVTTASYAIDISNPAGGACVAAGGPIRCRRVTVSPGGKIGSCDPAAGTGDSRAC